MGRAIHNSSKTIHWVLTQLWGQKEKEKRTPNLTRTDSIDPMDSLCQDPQSKQSKEMNSRWHKTNGKEGTQKRPKMGPPNRHCSV